MAEWEVYDRIDPIGKWRDDFRTARFMSFVSNIVSALFPPKGGKPKEVLPLDFMPDWTGDKEIEVKKQSPEEIKQIFMGIASQQKIRDKRRKLPPPRSKGEK